MRALLGLLYVCIAVFVFGVSSGHTITARSQAEIELWTYPLFAAYWTSRILIVTGWFTLLPALMFAFRLNSWGMRTALLCTGIAIGMYPIWEPTPVPVTTAISVFVLCAVLARFTHPNSGPSSSRGAKQDAPDASEKRSAVHDQLA